MSYSGQMLTNKFIIKLFIFIVILFLYCPLNAGVNHCAIIRFENLTAKQENDWIGYGCAETISSVLGQNNKIQLVEINQLEKLLSILKMDLSGLTSPAVTKKVGHLLGIDLLILGSFQITERTVLINSRLVEVKNGKIIYTLSMSDKINNLFNLQKKIGAAFQEKLNQQPGLAEIPDEQPMPDVPPPTLEDYNKQVQECYLTGSDEKAIACFQENIEKDAYFAEAYIGLANIYSGLNNFYLAKLNYQRALDIFRKKNNQKGISWIYFKLGKLYQTSNAADDALKYYQLALEIDRQTGEDAATIETYTNIAETLKKINKINDAINYCKKAVTLSKKIKVVYLEAVSLTTLSKLYLQQKNYSEALKITWEAIKLMETRKFPPLESTKKLLIEIRQKQPGTEKL